jgi:hypothetical protein
MPEIVTSARAIDTRTIRDVADTEDARVGLGKMLGTLYGGVPF